MRDLAVAQGGFSLPLVEDHLLCFLWRGPQVTKWSGDITLTMHSAYTTLTNKHTTMLCRVVVIETRCGRDNSFCALQNRHSTDGLTHSTCLSKHTLV